MTEGERIISLEVNMKNIEKKVDEGFNAITARFDKLEENMQENYASKWVEKVMIGVGATIGVAILGAIMSLIIINK